MKIFAMQAKMRVKQKNELKKLPVAAGKYVKVLAILEQFARFTTNFLKKSKIQK